MQRWAWPYRHDAVVALCGGAYAWEYVVACRGGYDLSDTTHTLPVLFVVALTTFKKGSP